MEHHNPRIQNVNYVNTWDRNENFSTLVFHVLFGQNSSLNGLELTDSTFEFIVLIKNPPLEKFIHGICWKSLVKLQGLRGTQFGIRLSMSPLMEHLELDVHVCSRFVISRYDIKREMHKCVDKIVQG
jgi:hypothetical protein